MHYDNRGGGSHGHRKKGFNKRAQGSAGGNSSTSEVDESNPIVQKFKHFQQQLDGKYDKHERLVKLSRDVTIDSKRTIFLLHRANLDSATTSEILEDAEKKLNEIRVTKWVPIAKELAMEDPYMFLRAYSPGLQEYIEALSLLHFMKTKVIIPLHEVENDLKFSAEDLKPTSLEDVEEDQGKTIPNQGNTCEEAMVADQQSTDDLHIHVPPVEYLLGIADLSGELMRMAIRSVSMGCLDVLFQLLSPIKEIHDSFVKFGNVSRELPRKLSTLKQSLIKVETACYALQIRGSEIPKHMLADVFSNPSREEESYEEAMEV